MEEGSIFLNTAIMLVYFDYFYVFQVHHLVSRLNSIITSCQINYQCEHFLQTHEQYSPDFI